MDNGYLISMQVFVPNPLALTNICIIFANRLAINKRMTITTSTHNAIVLRMIQKITPPILTCVKKSIFKSFFSFSLLHGAYALCGRAFCVLLFGIMLLVGAGCSQESLQSTSEMELLHAESSALGSVSPDSIQRFATKVETYASQNPASQADPLWPEIIENIKSAARGASIHFVITINTAWDGEIEYYF